MAILNSCLSTKNKTIITSLSPCESSISIPYTPRFREYSNGGYFYLLFFLVHCRLGSIFRATSGKHETKSWWWRASIPWICFFDAWKQPEHILPKGAFKNGDLLWNQPKTNPSILGGAQIDPSVNGLSPRIHPATLAWAVRCQASWDIEFFAKQK